MAATDDMPLYAMDFAFQDVLWGELGEDPSDFVTEHHFTIRTIPDGPGEQEHTVGKGMLSLIHFGLAMDAEFPLHDVMDASASILAMSEQLFSWEEDELPFEKLDEHFNEVPFLNQDVCFVERLEVLPAYRGRGIGRAALVSIARKFCNSCGLIVLNAYPLQHDAGLLRDMDEWAKAMRYDELEQDLERAQYQLFNWYQKMGLSNPFDMEYFIARPEELAHLSMTGEVAP